MASRNNSQQVWKLNIHICCCKQLAMAFVDQLQRQGKPLLHTGHQEDQIQKLAGTQPRGARSPLLLGEFKFKVVVSSAGLDIRQSIPDHVHAPFQGVPVCAKLISSRDLVQEGNKGEKKTFQQSTFGVFRSPWEFFQRTLQVEHPLDDGVIFC